MLLCQVSFAQKALQHLTLITSVSVCYVRLFVTLDQQVYRNVCVRVL